MNALVTHGMPSRLYPLSFISYGTTTKFYNLHNVSWTYVTHIKGIERPKRASMYSTGKRKPCVHIGHAAGRLVWYPLRFTRQSIKTLGGIQPKDGWCHAMHFVCCMFKFLRRTSINQSSSPEKLYANKVVKFRHTLSRTVTFTLKIRSNNCS